MGLDCELIHTKSWGILDAPSVYWFKHQFQRNSVVTSQNGKQPVMWWNHLHPNRCVADCLCIFVSDDAHVGGKNQFHYFDGHVYILFL